MYSSRSTPPQPSPPPTAPPAAPYPHSTASRSYTVLAKRASTTAQPTQQFVVIVSRKQPRLLNSFPTPRIASDPSGPILRSINRQRSCRIVVKRTHNHRPSPRHRHLHPATQQHASFVPAFQILHLSCSASLDPCRKPHSIQSVPHRCVPTTEATPAASKPASTARSRIHASTSGVHSPLTKNSSIPDAMPNSKFKINWIYGELAEPG